MQRRARHRPIGPTSGRWTIVLAVVVAAAAVVAAVVFVGHGAPHGDPDAAATSRLVTVTGLARVCLLDPADQTSRVVDDAAWTQLHTVATRRHLLPQRSPVPSGSQLVTQLDSAAARQCGIVVVIGAQWERPLASAAPRHRDRRFVLITTMSTTASSANVRVVRYRPSSGFTPSLDSAVAS